ncbi:hypothetical protein J4G07_05050 [Candidatus Poribacteria bacterium]|nr:hypothetical protein [Candidatus Poribacteria bacterium]
MSRNSVTGRFRDIEIAFSVEGTRTYMSVRNLISDERQVRVMYQKLAMSGLANWRQFQLTHTPVLLRLPTEVLEAYRLTFFVDNAEPISARIKKILAELDELRVKLPAKDLVENPVPVVDTAPLHNPNNMDPRTKPESELATIEYIEKVVASRPPKPVGEQVEKVVIPRPPNPAEELIEPNPAEELIEDAVVPNEPESLEETVIPSDSEVGTAEPEQLILPENKQEQIEERSPIHIVPKSQGVNVDNNLEFKITIPTLPSSARAKQRKAQAPATGTDGSSYTGRVTSKQKRKGIFGQFAVALGFPAEGRRGKAYYQEKGEAIQDDFQDKLSKLEKDYNEGYGLNLIDWDPETLCEEETAILLLNLMVNEVTAWQKETKRATPETKQLVETLTEVGMQLRQTLKQTRGISTPSPTLFPDLLAENTRDLEKIQSECDAYLHRFTKKLTEQEKRHASKIEVIVFKKFLIEFVRDFLFVEIAKNTRGNVLPKRLTWFLDLVDSEVIPIEIGKTKVSSNHHKVKGACSSEFESGTIVEVVAPGLQSKDGKRVSQMAVVIEAE